MAPATEGSEGDSAVASDLQPTLVANAVAQATITSLPVCFNLILALLCTKKALETMIFLPDSDKRRKLAEIKSTSSQVDQAQIKEKR